MARLINWLSKMNARNAVLERPRFGACLGWYAVQNVSVGRGRQLAYLQAAASYSESKAKQNIQQDGGISPAQWEKFL